MTGEPRTFKARLLLASYGRMRRGEFIRRMGCTGKEADSTLYQLMVTQQVRRVAVPGCKRFYYEAT